MMVCQWLSLGRLNGGLLTLDRLTGRRDRVVAYALSLAMAVMVAGETKAFMGGNDFIQAHPEFAEGLRYALGYTLHNQQLLLWLASLFALSIPFWSNNTPAGRPKTTALKG